MSRRSLSAAVAVLASLVLVAPASADSSHPLNAYRVKATAKNLRTLAQAGFDMTEGRRKDGTVEIVATARQASNLDVGAKVVRDSAGRTAAQRSAQLAPPADPVTYSGSDAEWDVWTRFDRVAGDNKEQYQEQYDRLSALPIVKREVLGKTYLNREIVALKVTKDAKTTADGSRPAVLYNAMQHAREWLAGETCRRTLDYFTANYGTDAEVTNLVDTRELWFVCVSNPDGYEYTFSEGNRLWRKNMADNNKNGVRGELGDGVDPNRNFATNWGRDDEGSSPTLTSETYRGPAGDSEPETKALKGLEARVHFAFQKNDHTAAELLLWPQGFQQYTPTPDNGIFEALAGDDATPAIADFDEDADGNLTVTGNRFDPDLSSELYITNGDALDDAYHNYGILGFTPEGTEADNPNVSGFEFADDEDAIEAEFLRHRRFALDLAKSAADPANPQSFLGNETNDFYLDRFATSWGDPQPVQVTAKRSLGALKLRYRINDGKVRTAGTSEWGGGERYGRDRGVYYHRLRGMVTGTSPGDEVEVWFEQVRGQRHSSHFHYRAVKESRAQVLIMSAEDYTGPSPAQDTTGPHYLSYYTDALDAVGIDYDVYDVDRRERTSPDWLGVLSHYDVVIWYTGDDFVTREPYQVPGTGTSRLALDEQIDVRDYLNEGGKLFYTGQFAGEEYSDGFEVKNYGFEQSPTSMCSPDLPEFNEDDPTQADGCITHVDDFLQYYLGAYRYVAGGNSTDDDGNLLPVDGLAGGPFNGLSWVFDDTGAGNQANSATFVVTSSVLDPARYPLYADSRAVAGWRRPGAAPFNPFSGSFYMAAGATDAAYKRLHRTVDLTGKTSGELSFMTSYDLEPDYDYMFVEVHNVTDDTWTTAPDLEGNTSDDTGLSCFAGGDGSDWQSLHPFLTHYQHKTGAESCEPTGEDPFTGEWNAATASSGGWVPWRVDLSPWAGKQIEVFITVATDPASLGLGVWVDDAKITVDGATVSETSFEDDNHGWTIGPPPSGTDNPENGWSRQQESFKEGAVVATKDSIYTGFGFEGMDAKARPRFMGAAMRYLGIKSKPHHSAPPAASPPKAHAAKFMQRLLKASRKGRVKVSLGCTSDTACKGMVRLRRNGKTLGKKAFGIDAGKSKRLTVKLSKSAKRMLANKGSLRVRLSVQGADASGGSINASRRIRLAR